MSLPTLSVLVISHNQKNQVARCLDSIVSQNLPFEYEVIISDDNSADGTWELEQEYSRCYPFIKCWQCNSDDCKPTIISERSGHNRSNAFLHSCGKYFIHIDADDWYRPGSDCLERQVRLLDENPHCSMCMQDEWCWDEGTSLDEGHANHSLHRFRTGAILTAEDYFRLNVFANNGVMMMRRRKDLNPARLFHKWYVDTVITTFHLQFGPIVCLDTNDWIYTQTPNTITNHNNGYDSMLLWGLDVTVFLAMLIPNMRNIVFLSSFSRMMMLDAVRCILQRVPISEQLVSFFKQFDNVFIFHVATKHTLSLFDKVRLYLIRGALKHIQGQNLCVKSPWVQIINYLCTAA